MKIELNNRSAVVISALFILINILVWMKYLFFYNPYHGAFDLLWTLPVGLIGTIPSMYIKHLGLKLIILIVNLLGAFSFLVPWILFILAMSLG